MRQSRRTLLTALCTGLLTAGLAALCGLPHALAQGKSGGGGGGSTPPPVTYSFEFLGDLGGVTTNPAIASLAGGLNNYGDVVGSAADEDGRLRGVLSTFVVGTRTLVNLYDLLSAEDRDVWRGLDAVRAINDSGVIMASALGWDPAHSGWIRITLARDEHGNYDWDQPPATVRLKDVLGFDVGGPGINAHADITGDYPSGAGTRAFLLSADLQAFVDLGTLHDDHNLSRGESVNANLQVAGYSGTNPGEFEAIFTSPETGMIGLGVFKAERGGFRQSRAHDLNEDGVVVGYASNGGSKRHAFRWTGTLQSLGTLGGDRSVAYSINNNPGAIVGQAQDKNGTYHAFLYLDGHGMAKLSDLVVDLPAGFRLSRDSDDRIRINDAGQIAGTGYDAAGIRDAYLLTPLP